MLHALLNNTDKKKPSSVAFAWWRSSV